jgi:type IV secretory pathway VirB10-like protein
VTDKALPPFDEPSRDSHGRFNKKTLMAGVAGIALVLAGLYAVAGITSENERSEPKGLQPVMFNAKVPEPSPQVAQMPPPVTKSPDPAQEHREEPRRPVQAVVRAPLPKDFKKSVLVWGNKYAGSMIDPMLKGSSMADAGGSHGQGGVTPAAASGGHQGNGKSDFYTGGGGRSKQGLYHPHNLQPELSGCVLKAGEELIIQTPNPVRTELPGQVRGVITEDAWGKVYTGNGQVHECIAIPAGSTTMVEVNATGVGRGDMRVQMCATRVDLLGGGIMPMECSPALGQDGGGGVEAESEYQWSGIATGILIDGALSFVNALGGLIQGPAGVAVQVGTQGIRGVGSEYVNRELMKPPVLTMKPGAIFRIQINSDISFSQE